MTKQKLELTWIGKEKRPKPEQLIQTALHVATQPGDLVLDSFAGSGTTGAVAHKMGRSWIMVELGGALPYARHSSSTESH